MPRKDSALLRSSPRLKHSEPGAQRGRPPAHAAARRQSFRWCASLLFCACGGGEGAPGALASAEAESAADREVPRASVDTKRGAGACAVPPSGALAAILSEQEPRRLGSAPEDGYSGGFSILEGPVWVGGALLLNQIDEDGQLPPPARLLRFTPGGDLVSVAESGSNGLALDPQGRLAAARHSDGSVAYIDASDPGSAALPIVQQYEARRFNSPNDLAFHSNGTLYFTDPDWQSPDPNPQTEERSYRVAEGQAAEAIEVAAVVSKPNGVALSLDETRLYIGGRNGLFRFELDAEGGVAAAAEVRLREVTAGVDGMTVDCRGNLYVTTGNRVVVFDDQEQVLATQAFPLLATNVELGGSDGLTLFVTTLETDGNKPALFSLSLAP